MKRILPPCAVFCSTLIALSASAQTPLGTAFSYQGELSDSGSSANGLHDLRFQLFTAANGGTQIGATVCLDGVNVVDGLFTAPLDFGPVFDGDQRFLQVFVRADSISGNCGSGVYTVLSPRQPLTAAPYALKVPGIDGFSLDASDGSPADALFLDSSGRVGIGTTAPTHPLHVRASLPLLNLQDSDSVGAAHTGYVRFSDSGNVERGFVGYGSELNTELTLRNLHPNGVTVISANAGSLAVSSNGGVGIGTTTPAVPLHVRNEFPVMLLQDSGAAAQQSGYLGFWNSSNVETGWMGYGTPGSPHLSIVNTRANGNIDLKPLAGGVVTVPVLEITGADLAEKFPASETLEPGMVVAIDAKNAGKLCLSRGAYNRCVAGVVSGANNFSVGAVLGNLPGHEDAPAIALSGRVYVQCDGSSGAIEPGDMLTTSDTPGYAMKAIDRDRSHGAVIGKAMERLRAGERSLVLVLVNLQ